MKKQTFIIFSIFLLAAGCSKTINQNSSMNSTDNSRIQVVNNLLTPSSTYKDYAFSKDASSYDQNNQFYKEIFPGRQAAAVKVTQTSVDHVKIHLDSINADISIPFGWYGVEGSDKATGVKRTFILSPDKTISLVFQYQPAGADIISSNQEILGNFDSGFNNPGDKKGTMVIQNIPNGLAYTARGYTSVNGASGENGDIFVVELYQSAYPNPNDPKSAVSFSLLTPPDKFDSYKGIMALIYQDLKAQIK